MARKGRKVYLQATQLDYELPPSSALLDASLQNVEQRLQLLGATLRKQLERRFLLGDFPPRLASAKLSLQGSLPPDLPVPQVFLATVAISAQGCQRLRELTQALIQVIESGRKAPKP